MKSLDDNWFLDSNFKFRKVSIEPHGSLWEEFERNVYEERNRNPCGEVLLKEAEPCLFNGVSIPGCWNDKL